MDENMLNRTGVYIAYPTSPTLKSIYRPKNYKTKVNDQHTKIGIAKNNFKSRKSDYLGNFDNEVEFMPVVLIAPEFLEAIEKSIVSVLCSNFRRVGRTEWFCTTDRRRISEIIVKTLVESGIEHEYVGNFALKRTHQSCALPVRLASEEEQIGATH